MSKFVNRYLLFRLALSFMAAGGVISEAKAHKIVLCQERIFNVDPSSRMRHSESSEESSSDRDDEPRWANMIQELEALPDTIEVLSFSNTGLDDVLLERLAQSFPERFTNLRIVDLSGNRLGGSCVEALLSLAEKCSSLESLVLCGNPGFGGTLLSENLKNLRDIGGEKLAQKLIVFESVLLYGAEEEDELEGANLLGEGWQDHHSKFYKEAYLEKLAAAPMHEAQQSIFVLISEPESQARDRAGPSPLITSSPATPARSEVNLEEELEKVLRQLTVARGREKEPGSRRLQGLSSVSYSNLNGEVYAYNPRRSLLQNMQEERGPERDSRKESALECGEMALPFTPEAGFPQANQDKMSELPVDPMGGSK